MTLVPGKLVHEPVNSRRGFHLFEVDVGFRTGAGGRLQRRLRPRFPNQALPLIGNGIAGNAKQPGSEGCATPLKLAEVCEGLLENVRGLFFRCRTFAYPSHHIGINAFEVDFIQFGKAAWILLRRLDQGPFLLVIRQTSPSRELLSTI